MTHASAQRLFAQVVDRPDHEIELDVAALILGDWDYDRIDVAHYLGVLDQFAAQTRARLDAEAAGAGAAGTGASVEAGAAGGSGAADKGSMAPAIAVVRALNHTLFAECAFRGNAEDYYDPRNSFLHEVIDRRVGIPITLSVLYIEVARRLGVTMHGVGFPGHFLVRYDGDGGTLVIDPFHRGISLDTASLEELLHRGAGAEAKLEATHLQPATKKQILTRMLTNLAGIYGRNGDMGRSIEILERLRLLDPENEKIEREVERLRKRQLTLN
jgi:hypothetical protein